MNANGLARNYTCLTPEERFRLILAASGRGDEAERGRLVNAGEWVPRSLPAHWPFAQAFEELSLLVFLELLEEVSRYNDAFGHSAKCRCLFGDEAVGESVAGTESEPDVQVGALPEQSTAERYLRLALASGFMLRTKADGWKLFCERLNVPTFLLWEGLPGFDRLQRALTMAERVAFCPVGFLRWMNDVRHAGEPELTEVPLTVEGAADVTAKMFRDRVGWWGG